MGGGGKDQKEGERGRRGRVGRVLIYGQPKVTGYLRQHFAECPGPTGRGGRGAAWSTCVSSIRQAPRFINSHC